MIFPLLSINRILPNIDEFGFLNSSIFGNAHLWEFFCSYDFTLGINDAQVDHMNNTMFFRTKTKI